MRKNRIKITVLLLLTCIIFTGRGYASTISDLENELSENKNDLNAISSRIDDVDYEKRSVANELDKLDDEILSLQSEQDQILDEIDDLDYAIIKYADEIKSIEENIDVSNNKLGSRVRNMYMYGSVSYMEVLIDSEDILDFMTRLDMVQSIVNNDVELLETLDSQKDELETAKLDLDIAKQNLALSYKDLNVSKNEYEIASRAKESYMTSLQQDINKLKAQEEQILLASSALEEKIKNMKLEEEYAGGEMVWPAPGYYRITSPYGMRAHPIYGYQKMHTGIDIGVPMNQKIVAVNSGTVTYAGWYGAYGNLVMVDHGGGISSVYAHNTKLIVSEGDYVTKGQQLSWSGTTGMSTGPHLHFEIRKNGVHQPPLEFLQ